jgi:hypothetical protein
MKTYDNYRPKFGRLARCDRDYRRWWMANESRGFAERCTEVGWRSRRIDEAVEMELALTLEWLKAAGQIARESNYTGMVRRTI